MSLLIVGSIAFDTVKTPYCRNEKGIGGSAIYSALTASFFTDVNLVGVIGQDFPQDFIELLKSKGINVEGVERERGESFYWEGEYLKDFNKRKTIVTKLGVFEKFKPHIPETYRKSSYLFLANIDPQLQLKIFSSIPRIKFSLFDTMNYWIEKTPDVVKKVMKKTHAITINEEEAEQLTGTRNLFKAGEKILEIGTKCVIIKKGEHGAIIIDKNDLFILPAFPVTNVKDPTGAGDSFAGGFCGYISMRKEVNSKILRQAAVIGTLMASFAIEDFSVNRLLKLKKNEIKSRYKQLKEITDFQLDDEIWR